MLLKINYMVQFPEQHFVLSWISTIKPIPFEMLTNRLVSVPSQIIHSKPDTKKGF